MNFFVWSGYQILNTEFWIFGIFDFKMAANQRYARKTFVHRTGITYQPLGLKLCRGLRKPITRVWKAAISDPRKNGRTAAILKKRGKSKLDFFMFLCFFLKQFCERNPPVPSKFWYLKNWPSYDRFSGPKIARCVLDAYCILKMCIGCVLHSEDVYWMRIAFWACQTGLTKVSISPKPVRELSWNFAKLLNGCS